jgi:transposase
MISNFEKSISYPFQYQNVIHALCNAHHLRGLTFILEHYHQKRSAEMSSLLLEIKTAVETAQPSQDQLSPAQIADYKSCYDTILAAGFHANPVSPSGGSPPKKRGKTRQHPAKNMLDHLQSRKRETLAFMDDFKVPFDDNQAERDQHMAKLK